MAGSITPATSVLTQRGVAFAVHTYTHERGVVAYGDEATKFLVDTLGVSPDQVFKTLVVTCGAGSGRSTLAVAVLPVPSTLSLKAMASALGVGKTAMADPAAVRRSTGYVLGGVSPLGQRTILPTVVDSSALRHERVFCSGGRRGLEIELDPAELVGATMATVADIRRLP